jgi:hypothetical protein
MEVVVLNCWVTDTNDTPCPSNSSTSLAKSANDRVSRASSILTDPEDCLIVIKGQDSQGRSVLRHPLGMNRFWFARAEVALVRETFIKVPSRDFSAAWPPIKMPGAKRQEWRKSSNHRQAASCSVNITLSVCKAGMCMSVNGSIQRLDGGSSCLSFALCASWAVLACRFLV